MYKNSSLLIPGFMNFKSKILCIKTGLITMLLALLPALLTGQQTPQYPVSYRIFSPFIFNPAIAGSKDFFSADILASVYGNTSSEVASGNLRLSKPQKGYFSSPVSPEFTKIGVGGSIFNESNDLSSMTGISGTASYHLQLDKNSLSFVSFGVTAKAVYNHYAGNPDLSDTARNTFFPNFDAGVYYYNENLFAGLSVTNILGNPESPDSLRLYNIPVSRQFFFQAGYKIVLSKPLNILLEPSVIVNSDDSFSQDIKDMIKPALKLYAGNFCTGTYFNDFNKISFFFQYKYPKFYIGTYFELPRNEPFYKNPIRAEFALGLNISAIKSGSSRLNHW
jgi:type IX secretion system PorP/SprF family membrane protein